MALRNTFLIVFLFFFLIKTSHLPAQQRLYGTNNLNSGLAFKNKNFKSELPVEMMTSWKTTQPMKPANWTHSPAMGAAVGFAIGGTYGILLGTFGKEWVLNNGKIVPKPIHAVVDMFIVGIPFSVMGLVVGARQERSTLEPSKFHVAVGGGWTSAMTYKTMLNAYDISGLPRHIPHWFGYLHYPDGDNSSNPYTWNLSADYNFTRKFSMGIALNAIVKQEIQGGTDAHHMNDTTREYAKGKAYGFFADYIINPIVPENKTRLVFAAGGGLALHDLRAGGALGGVEYSKQKLNVAPQFRATVDYYSRKNLSLQLKFGYRVKQTVTVPELIVGSRKLVAHAISFRALDITMGVRYHFN